MGRRGILGVAAIVAALVIALATVPVRAFAYTQDTVDASHIFDKNDLVVDFSGATLKGYSLTQNAAGSVQVYEHCFLHNMWVALAHGDLGAVEQLKSDPNSVSFRIPVPAGGELSNDDGQRLLDGVSFDLVLGSVGTYKGTPLQAEVKVSNLVDCTASQRMNGHPIDVFANPYKEIYGDDLGNGYVFSFKSYVGEYAQDYLEGWETEFFEGTESEDVSVTFEYEDGTPVTLQQGDFVLSSVTGLDRDGSPLGSEGVRITCAPERGYLSDKTTVVRGPMTAGLNGLGLRGDYPDSDEMPTYYGTEPTGSAVDDVNHGVTFVAGGEGAVARVSFTIIDQMGAIGFPMSFAPITAYEPDDPVKTVDKSVAASGDEVTYTVTQKLNDAKNNAFRGFRYTALAFEDVLDERLDYVGLQVLDGAGKDVTATAGSASKSGSSVRYAFSAGYLASLELQGQTCTFRITTRVNDAVSGGETIANQASVTFDDSRVCMTNTVETFVPRGPAKTESVSAAKPGETVRYRISQDLPRAAAGARSLSFSDVLDARLRYVSARMLAPDGADVTASAGTLLVEGRNVSYAFAPGSLPGLSSGTYVFEIDARVAEGSESQTIPNQGGVAIGECGEVSTNVVELRVPAPPVLGATVTTYKGSDPEPNSKVSGGDRIAYSLESTNTGASTAAHTLVRDYIPAGTAYVEGSASAGGVYVGADAQGNETGRAYVEWEHDDIAAGDGVTDAFAVTVTGEASSQIANHALTSLPSTRLTPGDPSNPEPTNPSNEVLHRTTDEPCDPVVQVVKSSEPVFGSKVQAGNLITYTLLVTNTGGSAARDIGVFDAIPGETSYAYGSVSGENAGRYEEGGNACAWVIPVLAPGASATLRFSVVVGASLADAMPIDNQASYAADVVDVPIDSLANTSNVVEHVFSVPAATVEADPPEQGSLPRTGQTLLAAGLVAGGVVAGAMGWRRARRRRRSSRDPKVY